MLVVFLLLAFTCLGQECQDFLSACNGMHVCIDKILGYVLIWKELSEVVSEPMQPPTNISIYPYFFSNSRETTTYKPMRFGQVGLLTSVWLPKGNSWSELLFSSWNSWERFTSLSRMLLKHITLMLMKKQTKLLSVWRAKLQHFLGS